MTYDRMVKEIGEYGVYQKKQCVIIFLAGIPNAFFIVSFAFTQFKTGFRCHGGENTTAPDAFFNLSSAHQTINWQNSTCEEGVLRDASVDKIVCPLGWDYQDYNTAVAEFNLVCNDAWKSAFVVTLYMLGMTTGAVTASLCDRFGRRPMYLLYFYVQSAAAGFVGCAWNFESYAAGTFIMGLCGFAGYNIGFTLATEIIPSSHQGVVAAVNLSSYITGFMLTPLISLSLPNWRWYLRFCGLVGVAYCLPLYWFFPESVRWQVISGRTEEAKKTVQRIARDNGKSVDVEELFERLISFPREAKKTDEKESGTKKDDSLINMYLQSPVLRNRLLSVYFSWATAVLLYFAISLNPASPESSRFLHIAIVGLAEIPGYLFGYIVWRRCGLRWSIASSSVVAAIACLAIPFIIASSGVALAITTFVGKCFCSSFYAYIAVVIGRISPTLVRHSAVSTAAAIGKIGGIAMPYLMYTADFSPDLPYLVMACAAFASAILILLFIPDTRKGVPDTIGEVESNQSNYLAFLLGKRKVITSADRSSVTNRSQTGGTVTDEQPDLTAESQPLTTGARSDSLISSELDIHPLSVTSCSNPDLQTFSEI